MHLPSLDIRVKQKGNHGMKWEINFEIVFKSEEKKNAATGNRTRTLQYVWFSAAGKSGYFDCIQQLGQKSGKKVS